jgi:hypothetical protein
MPSNQYVAEVAQNENDMAVILAAREAVTPLLLKLRAVHRRVPTVLDDEDLTTATRDLATIRRALEIAQERVGFERANLGD